MRARSIVLFPLMLLVAAPLAPADAPSFANGLLDQTLVEGHVVHLVVGDGALTAGPVVPHGGGLPLGVGPDITPPVAIPNGSDLPGPLHRDPYSGPAVHEFMPGVRWLNDQFVIDPVNNERSGTEPGIVHTQFLTGAAFLVGQPLQGGGYHYPCGGTLLVTNAGEPDPRPAFQPANVHVPNYVESYQVTDPNDRAWMTDKWVYADANGGDHALWTVPIGSTGSNCAPTRDAALARAMGKDGRAYPGRDATLPEGLQYNALVILFAEDLVQGQPIPHGIDGERTMDSARAGDSHAYDPYDWPARTPYPVHGGSGTGLNGDHATYRINAYYSTDSFLPIVRGFRVIDTQGSTAPFG